MLQGPHCIGEQRKLPPKNPYQGIWKYCQNTVNLYAQVVNSMILNIHDIAIFAAEFSNLSKSVTLMKMLQISEFGTGKNSR